MITLDKYHLWGTCLAVVVLLFAAAKVGMELGDVRAVSRLEAARPDCEIEVSNIVADSLSTLVVNLKQKAPCDLVKLRDQAQAELERVSEE